MSNERKNKVISVSRRTDIPAFYGKWFLNRIREGFAVYLNPFNNEQYRVSLKKEDVICFVFWSNNFIPFMDVLDLLNNEGYSFYFNYTINNYPEIFEPHIAPPALLADNLKKLSGLYSKKSINYRYDPVIISNITDFDFHRKNFTVMLDRLGGCIERCYFSFINLYDKVKKNIDMISKKHNIAFYQPDMNEKKDFASELADIASRYGVKLYSCCDEALLSGKISKAHCVDGDIIEEITGKDCGLKLKPTRKQCGCYESVDIGSYNTCIHGCIYCYANMNKDLAQRNFNRHDPDTVFLL